ncbi:FliM/FliN family flagellar motor switch protein [Conexibacter sp. SYSU D00693]|uniref:FliM/FliN family flagellar motor switch protein n=1 Tax=Conexibacter sp. SYSU D00693 TaxID=2812560 RepID=UPI00196B78F5|nr:FliM/FliN family flagellar motor switch protein [Conexibacter sp. SYSU D00693]
MNTEQALLRLAASTSEAVQDVLKTYTPDGVKPGTVDVVQSGHPLEDVSVPAVAADVSYVDGVTGGNVLVMPLEGARRLAATMMGADPDSVEPGGELDELSLSAVGEAMNQMMAAAARATSDVLGQEVEIAPPDVRVVQDVAEAMPAEDHAGQVTRVTFTVCGAPCTLVQLVPHAFIVRMTRALDEMTTEYDSAPLGESLRHVTVRVWAELGRTRMPSARVVGLPSGSVVELDHEADAPVDLYADGMRVASGRLVVDEDGTLALRVEQVHGAQGSTPNPTTPQITEVAA